MSTTPTTTAPDLADPPDRTHRKRAMAAPTLSVRRINVMRIGYLVMGVGLAATKWPLMIDHEPWPLMEGVANYMLVAMGLLALLGLRYPVKMVPILLFESLWKLIWLALVAAPLWAHGTMDAATSEMASAILWVLIILAVTPWRYVAAQYVTGRGDPWRSRGKARTGA